MKPFEAEAHFFKLLMHPARLEILDELRKDEACVCHLEAKLGYRQAYISQHIMVLRKAGSDPGPARRLEHLLLCDEARDLSAHGRGEPDDERQRKGPPRGARAAGPVPLPQVQPG